MNTNGGIATAQWRGNGGTNGGATAEWVRVADLYGRVAARDRTVREWVKENVPETHKEQRSSPGGGKPEWFIHPAAAERLQAAFPMAEPNGSNGGTPAIATAEPTAEAMAEGWQAALDEARARIGLIEAERDRLRSERDAAVQRAERAERQAEETERGRHAAQERLEALRGAWWRWYALAQALSLWARVRRRLPDPPAELVADRLLAKPAH
jgi:hypothetical protein